MNLPGVPPLFDKVAALGNKVSLLTADAKLVLGFFSNAEPEWGLYLDGKLAIKPDSIISLNAKSEWRIADYPMEKGAFQSYNKVKVPRDVRLRMTKGGKTGDKTAFLLAVKNAAESLNIYNVQMPEGQIRSVTIGHYDFDRTAIKGLGLLAVDIWLTEVVIVTDPTFTNTANYSGIAATQAGTVQGVVPPPGTPGP